MKLPPTHPLAMDLAAAEMRLAKWTRIACFVPRAEWLEKRIVTTAREVGEMMAKVKEAEQVLSAQCSVPSDDSFTTQGGAE